MKKLSRTALIEEQMSNTLEVDVEMTKGNITTVVYNNVSAGDIRYDKTEQPTLLMFNREEKGEKTRVYLPFYNVRGMRYGPTKVNVHGPV